MCSPIKKKENARCYYRSQKNPSLPVYGLWPMGVRICFHRQSISKETINSFQFMNEYCHGQHSLKINATLTRTYFAWSSSCMMYLPHKLTFFFFFQKMSHSSTVLFATRATYRQDKMFSSYPQRNGPLGVHVKNKLEKKMSHQLTTFVLSQQSNHVMHETVNSSGEKKRQVLITTCGKLF